MLFVYPTPQYPRRTKEYVFKSLYHLVSVFHVISISVLIADFYLRLQASMPEYFTNSNLVISSGIELLLSNCSYSGSIHLGSVRGTTVITRDNIGYALMTTAQYIIILFVMEFILLCNNTICAYNYTTENRHLRICGIHIPLYHITVTLTYVLSAIIIALTWSFDTNRRFFERALRYCAETLEQQNATILWNSEFDGNTIFSTAVYWPFGVTCAGLCIYFVAMLVLAYYSSDEGTQLLSEADAPWEQRGVMCSTSKPLLKLHTIQRNAILQDARSAIMDGEEVRIVRSYQLMTERDFEALVQAMRDQAARMMKEQQFEKLRENFGDRESQIDETQFMWRHNLTASPPSPTLADQFYDVDFDNYFDPRDNNNNNNDSTAQRRLLLEEPSLAKKQTGNEDVVNANVEPQWTNQYIRYNNDNADNASNEHQFLSKENNLNKRVNTNSVNNSISANAAYYSPISSEVSSSVLLHKSALSYPEHYRSNQANGVKRHAEVYDVINANNLNADPHLTPQEVVYVEPQAFSPTQDEIDFDAVDAQANINELSYNPHYRKGEKQNEQAGMSDHLHHKETINRPRREHFSDREYIKDNNNSKNDNNNINARMHEYNRSKESNNHERRGRIRRAHSLEESPYQHSSPHNTMSAFPTNSSPDVFSKPEVSKEQEEEQEQQRVRHRQRRSRKSKDKDKDKRHRQRERSSSAVQQGELEDVDEKADELSESFDENIRY